MIVKLLYKVLMPDGIGVHLLLGLVVGLGGDI